MIAATGQVADNLGIRDLNPAMTTPTDGTSSAAHGSDESGPLADPHAFFREKIASGRGLPEDYTELLRLLWESYGQQVFLYARARLRNEHDARDVCQEVFVRALSWLQRNVTTIPARLNFPGWLQRIGRNRIVDFVRKNRRLRPWPKASFQDEDDPREIALADRGPQDDPSVSDEQLELLRRCIEQLTDQQRRAVVWFELEGLDYKTLVQRMQVSMGTVGSLLHRARRHLRECFQLRLAMRPT